MYEETRAPPVCGEIYRVGYRCVSAVAEAVPSKSSQLKSINPPNDLYVSKQFVSNKNLINEYIKRYEQRDKPGSVEGDHLSGPAVTDRL